MNVIGLIPARENSKGIPKKNVTPLAGRSPMNRAMDVCHACIKLGVMQDFYVTSDIDWGGNERWFGQDPAYQIGHWLLRPPELAQDDTPMIDVVKHALAQIPGPPEQIIVLLQPTQPLRTPEHVKAAIALLESSGVDSVVSVVALPLTHSPDMVCEIQDGRLLPWPGRGDVESYWSIHCKTRRQDATPAYLRDGTVYAFRRENLNHEFGTIYGGDCRPLIIPASESCPLDSPADWADAERRLQA